MHHRATQNTKHPGSFSSSWFVAPSCSTPSVEAALAGVPNTYREVRAGLLFRKPARIYMQRPSVALPPRASFLESPGSLCCFWRPRCLPFPFSPSLLGALWRGPGPASPKANPNYRQPTVRLHSLSASLRAPLAGNGAPYIYATPVCCTSPGLPSLNPLALSAASGVPVAFLYLLSFSAWGPLAGTGARKPKSQPKLQTTNRPAPFSLCFLSGRPLPGTGPLIYMQRPSVALPPGGFLP